MDTYLVLFLLAGIVAMDTTSGPQILLSEPLVSCSALGLLFGKPEIGLMLGTFFQLLWLGYLPLGGFAFIDNNMAAFISTASLFSATEFFGLEGNAMKAAFIPIMLFGIFIGIVGLHIRNIERRLNDKRSDILLSSLERREKASVKWDLFAGISTSFFKGVLMAVIFVPIGTMICGIVVYLPSSFIDSMSLASLIIWGTVSASAVLFYSTKGKSVSLILGTIGGFLWILFRMV